MKTIFLTLTILAALSVSASAQSADGNTQISDAPAILVTTAVNGVPGDGIGGINLQFGGLIYIVTYAQQLNVWVNVRDRNNKIITTGSVVLRVNSKDYPVSYAGPSPFPAFAQVNIPIPADEFPAGSTAYLRICDFGDPAQQVAPRCKNSTGATVRVAP